MSSPLLILGCGTYDGTTLALTFDPVSGKSGHKSSTPAELTTKFIDTEAHTSSVRAIAVCSDVLVSGAGDEYIQVYSIKNRNKVGALDLHSGTINQLTFHSDSKHLISCSEDASLSVWRYVKQENSWDSVRRLARHKESITAFALHPTGRFILSVGQDRTMRTWNLMRGRQAYVTRLKDIVKQMMFCPKGDRFLHIYDNKIEVFNITNPLTEATLHVRQSINDVAFLNCTQIVVAVGNSLSVYEIGKNVILVNEATVSSGRAKLVKFVPDLTGECSGVLIIVSTAAGASRIDGYQVTLPVVKNTQLLNEQAKVFSYHQENIRITCLAACWNIPADSNTVEDMDINDLPEISSNESSEEEADSDSEKDRDSDGEMSSSDD